MAKIKHREPKDSYMEKLICQSKVKDVSKDNLYKDILKKNSKLRVLQMELDDKEDEIEFLNIFYHWYNLRVI